MMWQIFNVLDTLSLYPLTNSTLTLRAPGPAELAEMLILKVLDDLVDVFLKHILPRLELEFLRTMTFRFNS